MVIAYEVGNGLYVNITNRCTNACSFCVRSVADGTYGELWLEREPTADEITDAVIEADPAKYGEVVFCGYGEPTVRFYDVILVASRLKQKYPSVKIRINTNGHANLIHGKDVTPLMKGVIDSVSISLNTADAESYVKVCAPEFGTDAYDGLLDFIDKNDGREVRKLSQTDAFRMIYRYALTFLNSDNAKHFEELMHADFSAHEARKLPLSVVL